MDGRAHPEGRQPREVFWELTTGCNLRCLHCRASSSDPSSTEDLGYSECCEIIDRLAEYAPLHLTLGGGEPLWRRDVFDLAKRATDKGVWVALATNGALVDEAMAQRIEDAGVLRVAVGLDGADRVTHDTFRGVPGVFEAAVTGIRNVIDLGIATHVNTTVARHNLHQLPEILELAKDLDVDGLHLFLGARGACGLPVPEEDRVGGDEADRVIRWLRERSPESKMDLTTSGPPGAEGCFISSRGQGTFFGIK